MVNKLAAAAAAAVIMSLTGCGAAETAEVTFQPAEKQTEAKAETGSAAAPSGETPALPAAGFTGNGYSLSLPADKWVSSDSYVSMLEENGYTFDPSASQLRDDSDGIYYFVDESVKEGMEKDHFTYDVPYMVIGIPEEDFAYDIASSADEKIARTAKLYESIDGLSVDVENSGTAEIGGRKFVRTAVDNVLAGGEIHLRQLTYQTSEGGRLYTFTFSSSGELAERMLPEYEAVLGTFKTQ